MAETPRTRYTDERLDEEFESVATERSELRAKLRRDRIVSTVLYAMAFVGIVLSVGALAQVYSLGEQNTQLIAHVQDQREQRVREQAEADLVICARGNYQDARDKLQDQLLRDLVAVPPGASEERRTLFAAAVKQLERRLATQPPSIADLLKRWRGNPVSDRVEREREREAAGSVARAEARDRDDRIQLPVDCDELPSQRRPFSR
jgi:hypothetical protein